MKIRNLTKILLIQIAIVTFSAIAFGQVETGVTFANGITVAHTTDYGNKKSKQFYASGTSSTDNGLVAHQAFINETNKTYTGYDLEVVPQDDSTKFKILIKPLSIKSDGQILNGRNFTFIPIPKYPDELLISDGDIITLDIFENPKTKEKITDFIIVTRKKRVGPRFASKYIPKDFSLDDIKLSFFKYKIMINGKSFYKSGGGVSGNSVAFYLPSKGRVILSPFPRKGYPFQKTGVITNNKLQFSHKDEKYEIISDSPILGGGGKWHCWVIFQPNYVPKASPDLRVSGKRVFAQSGDIKFIYNN